MRSFDSLRGRRAFALVMRKGVVASAPAATTYAFMPSETAGRMPKLGVVVTKKVGNAVVRNRVRRRCKAALERLLPASDPRWYVIHCKAAAATIPFAELSRQLEEAIARRPRSRKRRS